MVELAVARLMDAARLLFKIVRMLIRAITKIIQAATSEGTDRSTASNMQPPEPRE